MRQVVCVGGQGIRGELMAGHGGSAVTPVDSLSLVWYSCRPMFIHPISSFCVCYFTSTYSSNFLPASFTSWTCSIALLCCWIGLHVFSAVCSLFIFPYFVGGRCPSGSPIITFPEISELSSDDQHVVILKYLLSVVQWVTSLVLCYCESVFIWQYLHFLKICKP